MKNLLLRSPLAVLVVSFVMVSCDDDDRPPFDPEATQEAFESLIDGDILTFTPTTEGSLGTRDIRFDGGVTTTQSTLTFAYTRTDDDTFRVNFIREANTVLESTLTEILEQGILGTELRSLLLDRVDDGDDVFVLSSVDLERIRIILNDFGNDLRVDPVSGSLFFPTNENFDFLITSTSEDAILNGVIGGFYTSSSEGFELDFRRAEAGDSRFFGDNPDTTAEFFVPTLVNSRFIEVEESERGLFSLNLNNIGTR